MKEHCLQIQGNARAPPADRTLLHEKVLTQTSSDLPPMYKPPPSRLPKPKSVANIWPALQRSSHTSPPHIVETAFRHQSRSSTPAKSLRNFLQKSFAPDNWGMRNMEEDKRSRKTKRPSLTQFVPIPQVMRRRTSTETSETMMGKLGKNEGGMRKILTANSQKH